MARTHRRWLPVELVDSEKAQDGRALVPSVTAGRFSGGVPSWLLVRIKEGESPEVVAAVMVKGDDEETAIKVRADLLEQLKAPDVAYSQAEVRPANWFDRVRYDNSARLTAGAATLGVLAGAWGIVEAAAGSDAGWLGIVGGVIAMLLALASALRSA